ncbi:glycosyltransferase family 39 protein [Actinacidiphila yanglinensis]|uniref:glycosyltransferase family 39 protein n=1 Tax=Actinacidiphila yanglinensis TaxID=310779 RepID=UPI001F402D86|nr:glycosyltransferase family 39 protein [Actinacidiphila yanglinensis]
MGAEAETGTGRPNRQARVRRSTRWPQRWTHRPAARFAVLLVLALAVRAPSFRRPFWSPDEGYLATEAVALRHGGRMYADVVDRKPPLVPWLYEACFAVSGPGSLWLVRACAVVALAVTALFVARLAAAECGAWAAWPAGVLTVAASTALPAPDAMAATFEIFMLPATAAAMYYGSRRRFLAAGAVLAVATLTKQVGLAPLLPLAVQVLTSPRRRRLRSGAALAAGLLVPVTGCALLLGTRPFVFWVFLSSGSYADSPAALGAMCGHVAGNLLRLAVLFGAFVPFLPRFLARRPFSGFDRVLWLWLLASAAGVTAGFHFYGHYFLQLVPPLVLLALRAVRANRFRPELGSGSPPEVEPGTASRPGTATRFRTTALSGSRGVAVAVAAALAVCGVFTAGAWRASPPQMGRSLAVAAAVDAHSTPGQRVLLWGMHPEEYWLAGRPASSRYLTAGLLTNFSGGADVHRVGARYAVPGAWTAFRRELAAAPPCLVVDESAGTPYRVAGYPPLARLLARSYLPVAVVDSARIYRRTGGC